MRRFTASDLALFPYPLYIAGQHSQAIRTRFWGGPLEVAVKLQNAGWYRGRAALQRRVKRQLRLGFRDCVRTTVEGKRWSKHHRNSSRVAAACESPARKCRVKWNKCASPVGTTPVLTHVTLAPKVLVEERRFSAASNAQNQTVGFSPSGRLYRRDRSFSATSFFNRAV